MGTLENGYIRKSAWYGGWRLCIQRVGEGMEVCMGMVIL